MFERYQEIQSRRHNSDGNEVGFTLIELLIVIVVLGILAAIVIFSLTGVTGQSAQAACNSDAKTVETAVAAYHAQNPTSLLPQILGSGAVAGGGNNPLLGTNSSNSYLHSWPNAGTGAQYTITYTGDTSTSNYGQVQVSVNGGTPANFDGGTACNGA